MKVGIVVFQSEENKVRMLLELPPLPKGWFSLSYSISLGGQLARMCTNKNVKSLRQKRELPCSSIVPAGTLARIDVFEEGQHFEGPAFELRLHFQYSTGCPTDGGSSPTPAVQLARRMLVLSALMAQARGGFASAMASRTSNATLMVEPGLAISTKAYSGITAGAIQVSLTRWAHPVSIGLTTSGG